MFYNGTAVFTPSENRDCVSLVVEGSEGSMQVQAKHVIIASGASPFIPEIPGLLDVDFNTLLPQCPIKVCRNPCW
jgi:mercuric reductase